MVYSLEELGSVLLDIDSARLDLTFLDDKGDFLGQVTRGAGGLALDKVGQGRNLGSDNAAGVDDGRELLDPKHAQVGDGKGIIKDSIIPPSGKAIQTETSGILMICVLIRSTWGLLLGLSKMEN